MGSSTRFVIVGGGLAAAKAAETLRGDGFDGRLTIVGAEQHLPYERPPLSKGYLLGTDELEKVFVHPREWYADNAVDLRLGAPVTALDLGGHTVTTDDGTLAYDRLLLATGSSPRRLAVVDEAAAAGARVAYLRTIEDGQRLKAQLRPGVQVVVVGGGWIGLEVASAARAAGCEVTVLESLELPLVRVLGAEVAEVFADLHRGHGVDLRTGVGISGAAVDAGVSVVRLEGGATVTGDLVVVGVGAAPDVSLAEAAGLRSDGGVVVDEYLRSSDPDVFAAGDVASAYHPVLHRHLRVEHWDNAIAQGAAAARSMLGAGEPYTRLPYFFTDQYDLGMEYVGNVGPEGYDEVALRGDVPARVFTAFWLKDGRVVAGMHVNDWDAIDRVRAAVQSGRLPEEGAPPG